MMENVERGLDKGFSSVTGFIGSGGVARWVGRLLEEVVVGGVVDREGWRVGEISW